MERLTGRVKWFNNKAGYGFITLTDGPNAGSDIFVHHSSIMVSNEQYKYLVQGEYVDFDLVKANNDKHEYHAVNISGVKGGHSMCETRRINMTTMQDVRQNQPRPVRDDAAAPRTYRTSPNSSRQSDNSGGYVKSSKGPRVKNE